MSETTTQTQAAAPGKKEKPKHEGRALVAGPIHHSLVPKNFEEAKEMSKLLASSDIVPKEFIGKPANILVAIMFGNELGLAPAQALQNIMVVNGRPALWGDAVMGKVEASGLVEWWKDDLDEKTMTVTFTVKRKGRTDPIRRTFSQADAQKAGLWSKQGPWTNYPKRMLFQRARAFALRDTFPDVLKGLRIADEDRDIIEVTEQSDGSYAMPQATDELSATQAAASTAAPAQPEAAPKPADKTGDVDFVVGSLAHTTIKDAKVIVVKRDGDGSKFYADPGLYDFLKAAEKAGHLLRAQLVTRDGVNWIVEVAMAPHP